MLHYLAFVWDSADVQAAAEVNQLRHGLHRSQPAKWQVALERNDVFVMFRGAIQGVTGCHPIGDEGVVLGTLFEKRATQFETRTAPTFSQDTVAKVVSSSGKHLVDTHWGQYIAFIANAHSKSVSVLRAPVSHLPCFHLVANRVHVYFSDIEDVLLLSDRTFTINWEYMAARLVYRVQSQQTGLQDVTELLPGQCVRHWAGNVSATSYWNPLLGVDDPIEDVATAAAELRAVVRHAVHSWASRFDRILHNLSGGVDSSIVLACLGDSPNRLGVTCVTHFSTGVAEDERRYARASANKARCQLIELERDTNVRYPELLRARRTPTPAGYTGSLEAADRDAQLRDRFGATGHFFGIGGDEIFFRTAVKCSLPDYISSHGIVGSSFQKALRVAILEGSTVWSVFTHACWDGLVKHRYRPSEGFLSNARLVHPDIRRALWRTRATDPSWCRSTRDAPLGKLMQSFSLSARRDYEDTIGPTEGYLKVSPLLSQPVVELAMRIPSYVFCGDGIERALARRAFSDDLPTEIRTRMTKGTVEDHHVVIAKRNLPFMRELLLDGMLVKEKLVDKGKLHRQLANTPSGESKSITEVITLLNIEVWLSLWNNRKGTATSLTRAA
jgi:asparagine synthase (glutamine-hydrolysing)